MALFLVVSQGKDAATADPIFATTDQRIIFGLTQQLLLRMGSGVGSGFPRAPAGRREEAAAQR